jgi:integrase
MSHSTTSAGNGKPSKPSKPYPNFPLFAHRNGQWAKKIRGKLLYFGLWADREAALNKYLDQKDDLHAGRTPRVQGKGLTVRDLVNRFLTSKRHLLDTREITPRTFADYHGTCERIGAAFGFTRLVDDLAADDFERYRAAIAKSWGPVALGNEIQRVRTVFKYGFDAGLIDKPIRYGPAFKRPSKKVLRKARNEKGPRMFEAAAIRKLLKAARPQLRAMILLGVNAGFGNADCGTLPIAALDLEGGWVTYPRPKTGIQRRAKLWPETVQALRAVLTKRKAPKDSVDAGLVFITKYGASWAKGGTLTVDDKGKPTSVVDNPVTKEMKKLLLELKLHRPGAGFYTLRHVLETIGGEAKDQSAVDHIMGHARDDMASVYRERISDERLAAVAQHVHDWLFPPEAKKRKSAKRTGKLEEKTGK